MCVFSSVKSKQRYFIVKADNTKGPAFDLTEQFFQKSICLNENCGNFACISCYKMLQRISDMDCRRRDLYNKLMSTSQIYTEITVIKRFYVGNQTPLKKFPDNKATPSPSSRSRDIDMQCVSRGKVHLYYV